VAIQIVAFFAINPYCVSLTDWRNTMTEEASALMHSSVQMNLFLKSLVVMALLIVISIMAYICLILCIDSLDGVEMWVSMLFDSASLTLPFICFGLYSRLPIQAVQILAGFPFLFMVFFSTTFSPGAGIPVIKELRYLFARFYLWCRLPGEVGANMEGCPPYDSLVWYTVLTGCLGLILFFSFQLIRVQVLGRMKTVKAAGRRSSVAANNEFSGLQEELYGKTLQGGSLEASAA